MPELLEIIADGKNKRTKISIQNISRGAWVAQMVEHLPLDFGSGYDLTVRETEPCFGLCADSAEPAPDSLSPSLSLSQNK